MTEQAAQQMLAVLEKTVSQNTNDQKQAMEFIAAACQQDFPVFVQCLSMILRTQQCQSFVRQAAGLQLKNVLCAKETETRSDYLERNSNHSLIIQDNLLTCDTCEVRPQFPSWILRTKLRQVTRSLPTVDHARLASSMPILRRPCPRLPPEGLIVDEDFDRILDVVGPSFSEDDRVVVLIP
uniref:Importin N-terminal domain-containing protein n=2 Tax=Caenorhabditis japonica TaxID=281687 RepID=A0A8R1ENA4_CAEJA